MASLTKPRAQPRKSRKAKKIPRRRSSKSDAWLGKLRASLNQLRTIFALLVGLIHSDSGLVSAVEPFDHTTLAALVSHPPQASNRQGRKTQCIGHVDDATQHLVVAGRAQVEVIANRTILGAGVEPPGTLELENGLFAISKHALRVRPRSREEWYLRADGAEELTDR